MANIEFLNFSGRRYGIILQSVTREDRAMSGTRMAAAAAVLIVLGGFAPVARAQDSVPGGWASEVSFQSFRAPGESVGFGFGGVSGYGVSSTTPIMTPASGVMGGVGVGWYGAAPRVSGMHAGPGTVNALGPLGDTIRKSSRKRTRR